MIRNDVTHASGAGRSSTRSRVVPADRRDPGSLFIEQEIAADRRAERWLWLKAVVAIALVGAMILVRQVFFA